MKKAMKAARRAFTLIELIITIVIIGILAAIALVGYSSVVDRADQSAAETSAQINARRVVTEMALDNSAMTEASFLTTASALSSELVGSFADDATADATDGVVEYTAENGRTASVDLSGYAITG